MSKMDTIERTIKVTSPIERVWEALTMAERLAEWFGDSAEVDLRPGGAMAFGWSEYGDIVRGVVEEVDRPSLFSYRWDAGTTSDGTAWTTKVTFVLDEADGVTTVTVTENGFAALPDELYETRLRENTSGWQAELADLQAMLEASAVP